MKSLFSTIKKQTFKLLPTTMETKSIYVDIVQSLEALLKRVSTYNDSKDLSTFLDKATKRSSKWNYLPVSEMRTLVSELNDLLDSLEKQPDKTVDSSGYRSASLLQDWIDVYYDIEDSINKLGDEDEVGEA
jgi:hypothetical protein